MGVRDVIVRLIAQDNFTPTFDKLNRDLQRTTREAGNTQRAFSGLASGLLSGITLGAAAGLATELYNIGRQASLAATTFENLSGGAGQAAVMLNALQTATGGIVDNMTLMQGANKLMSMGLASSTEDVSRLTEMAIKLGGAMGSDVTSSLENFALLLANQSVLRLDTFGISSARVRERIEELIETGQALNREDAFRMAVLEEGTVAMDRLGAAAEAAGTPIARLQARWTNFTQEAGMATANLLEQAAGTLEMLLQLGELTQNLSPDQAAAVREQLPFFLQGFGTMPSGVDLMQSQREAALAALGIALPISRPFPQGLYNQAAPTTLPYTLDTERIRADMIDRLTQSLQMPFMQMTQLNGGVFSAGMFASQEDANTARALYAQVEGALQALKDADVGADILDPMTRAAAQAREIRDAMVEGAERLENMDLSTAMMPFANANELLTGIFEQLGISGGDLTPKQREQMMLATGQATRTSIATQDVMARLRAMYTGPDSFSQLFGAGTQIEEIFRLGREGGASEGDIISKLYGLIPQPEGARPSIRGFQLPRIDLIGQAAGTPTAIDELKSGIEDAIDVTKQFDDALTEVTSKQREIAIDLSVNTSAIPKQIMDLIMNGAFTIVGAGTQQGNGRVPGATTTGGRSGSSRPDNTVPVYGRPG